MSGTLAEPTPPPLYDESAPRLLYDENTLERAESVLGDWATVLAEAGRDSEAAEALRTAAAICKFRCSFLDREKR